MARKRTGLAEDVLILVSKLPWPAGIALALGSYLWLHWIAANPPHPVAVKELTDLGKSMQGGLWRTLASLGQYVLPILCTAGAAVSFIGRRKRKRLLALASGEKGRAAVADMSWRDFELLVGEYFRQQGYAITESNPGPDGGIDLRLEHAGEPVLVQCKHWKRRDVGVKVVRELYGVMASELVTVGIVVASGGFTAEARRFAERVGIELVDGQALQARTQRVRREPVLETLGATAPSCPRCGGSMVARVAKRGSRAGEQFLGCAKYPRCNGTV